MKSFIPRASTFTRCENSESVDVLMSENPLTETQNEFLAACAKCKNHKIDTGPKRKVRTYTKVELEREGYEVWPYPYKNKKNYADLDEMRDDVGERIKL